MSPPEQGNGPLPWSDLQTEFVERTPERTATGEPSTKKGIETVRLCALLFQAHLPLDLVSSFFLQRWLRSRHDSVATVSGECCSSGGLTLRKTK